MHTLSCTHVQVKGWLKDATSFSRAVSRVEQLSQVMNKTLAAQQAAAEVLSDILELQVGVAITRRWAGDGT